jgi:hypothetical protein
VNLYFWKTTYNTAAVGAIATKIEVKIIPKNLGIAWEYVNTKKSTASINAAIATPMRGSAERAGGGGF